MRQQLQQHLRNQHSALRGYGDYLRRNLRLVLELALDPVPVSGGGPVSISSREVDRLAFLFKPLHQRHGRVQGVRVDLYIIGAYGRSKDNGIQCYPRRIPPSHLIQCHPRRSPPSHLRLEHQRPDSRLPIQPKPDI